jgi:hypothetical protein
MSDRLRPVPIDVLALRPTNDAHLDVHASISTDVWYSRTTAAALDSIVAHLARADVVQDVRGRVAARVRAIIEEL